MSEIEKARETEKGDLDDCGACGGTGEADTTALARRLAEALKFLVARCEHQPTGPDHAAMLSTQGWKERKALSDAHDALAEARKHKLIE